MSKRTGQTRIPSLFGSRLPITGQNVEQVHASSPVSSPQFRQITFKDIGKKVRFSEKQGVLRFVGNVHFNQGVWCGIELPNAAGKNDGLVRGVRYFACPENCGLMAPLCKVALLEDNQFYTPEDVTSGPHSILFGIKESFAGKSKTNSDFVYNNKPSPLANSTSSLSNSDSGDINDETVIIPYGGNRRDTYEIVRTHNLLECQLNTTIDRFDRFTNYPNLKTKTSKISNEETNQYIFNQTCSIGSPDVGGSPRRRFRASPLSFAGTIEEDATKRDSLEFEESLGILTPDQMTDATCFSDSPSSENISPVSSDLQKPKNLHQCDGPSDQSSPILRDLSIKDQSLGLIDEHVLLNHSMKFDKTINMELLLDSVENQAKNFTFTRLEQTPSPEDLPLDPTPVIQSDCSQSHTSKSSKTTSSFVTSITSITSLDTGYQGDGEMSRPASRGPDHSPLTRRPLPRPEPRRPDPMTDSDFYTESDADNHEEHNLRGDRHARVIDGTLYGVDPQAAADIYVNNRENMDSSGIFTDIEGNTRTDELLNADVENENKNLDVSPSPSDTSTKTISNDSQNIAPASRTPLEAKSIKNVELLIQLKSPSVCSSASSPASIRSPRHTPKDEIGVKKYKMPKRNVASKVKAVLESNSQQSNKDVPRITQKKTAGRWDAVMNKISKSSCDKPNLKEIRSKVFATNSPLTSVHQNTNTRTSSMKLRRNRTRAETSTTKTANMASLHSSASDLSGASPAKRIGSTKKKAEVVRVTQVLTPGKLSPRSNHKKTVFENKKNAGLTAASNNNNNNNDNNKLRSTRIIPNVNEKKQTYTSTTASKDSGRATGKGGRASPGARPPHQTRVPVHNAPRTSEALAVLVQHLVFNLEAFQTPSLKKQLEKTHFVLEEAQESYKQMEEILTQTRLDHARIIEEERSRYQKDIASVTEQHEITIAQMHRQQAESEQLLSLQYENMKEELILSQNDQLLKLRAGCNKLQKTHEQTLEILREENDSIREEIDEKNATIAKLQLCKKEHENSLNAKTFKLKEELNAATEVIVHFKEQNSKLMSMSAGEKENKFQVVSAEVESLRAVLELKQTEVSELRRALGEANQKAELLPSCIEKVSVLTARCEDLQSQLEHKSLCEHQLISANKKLQESLKEEFNHSKRLSQHNEELQWKLKQNKEVVTRVLEQAEESAFNRTLLSASFNERHVPPRTLERTMSFRERSLNNKSESCNQPKKPKKSYDSEEISPPTSPIVKAVVEKSDSVSYVLDMEESPEMIANRIVRRSFRNSTPPKSASLKSPGRKQSKNALSLSASAGDIMPSTNRNDHLRSRSVSVRSADTDNEYDEIMWHMSVSTSTPFANRKNNMPVGSSMHSRLKLEHHIDFDDNDDDIKLPALPSEIGRKNNAQSLPLPKHLAGEAMISESNSEDESTTSSSSGQL